MDDAVKAARERAVADEIREAKSMGYDDDASIEDSASIADGCTECRQMEQGNDTQTSTLSSLGAYTLKWKA